MVHDLAPRRNAMTSTMLEPTAPPTADASAAVTKPGSRVRSVDVARGVVVAISTGFVLVSPAHAGWYGLEPLDLLFPAFLTLSGTAVALGMRGGVRWGRLARRTTVLILLGLAFNALVARELDLGTLRLPGVLQRFALVGLLAVLLAAPSRRWGWPAAIGVVVLAGYQLLLLASSGGCPGGVPQPDCNLPGTVDQSLFGAAHLYHGGAAGHDPEGLVSTLGALGSALLGLAAGRLVADRRARAALPLSGLAAAALLATPLLATGVPIAKRLWTPSFAALTVGSTIAFLAVVVAVVEGWGGRPDRIGTGVRAATWLPEAFGRNSLLVYFGRYLVGGLLAVMTLPGGGTAEVALREWLAGAGWSVAWGEAVVAFLFWSLVASVLHLRRWYVRV